MINITTTTFEESIAQDTYRTVDKIDDTVVHGLVHLCSSFRHQLGQIEKRGKLAITSNHRFAHSRADYTFR